MTTDLQKRSILEIQENNIFENLRKLMKVRKVGIYGYKFNKNKQK